MSWVRRFVNVLRPARLGRDLDRELQFHIAERADDLVARGMSPSDAAREGACPRSVACRRRPRPSDRGRQPVPEPPEKEGAG